MRRITIDPAKPDPKIIKQAGLILECGGLVAFPTETVYGLGVALDQPDALWRLYHLKQRPADKPLTLHLSERSVLEQYAAEISPGLSALLDEFWPGPLNVVVKTRFSMPLSRGRSWSEAGFRLPDSLIARALASEIEGVVLTTSANFSGSPESIDADMVIEQLGEGVDFVLDAGPCPGGTPSTVVRVDGRNLEILREGAVQPEALRAIFQKK